MKKVFAFTCTAAIAGVIGHLLADTGVLHMSNKAAFAIEEPLLIAGEQRHYSILPAGTVLYYDRAWPEGHQTFHAYFHFKGEFKAKAADPAMITPQWLRTVEPDELPKLLHDYPITKDELVAILRARRITKAELIQIVHDWPDQDN